MGRKRNAARGTVVGVDLIRHRVVPFANADTVGANVKGSPMHRLMVTAVAALGVCGLASCTSSPPPPTTANLGPTEGTITFTGGAVAIGIGFQWGGGTLTYQGQQYPFRLDGLSVVDVGEASAEERAGQPLSRDRKLIPGADTVCVVEGNMSKGASASTWSTWRGRRTWHARTLLVREPGGLRVGRWLYWADGPRWEGEEP